MSADTSMKAFRYIHEWTHDRIWIVFHTIPTIHIGAKPYYERISSLIDSYNHLLVEGVPLKLVKEIGSYKTIAKEAGLTTQIESLRIPPDLSVTNVDMDRRMFAGLFDKLPFRSKLLLFFVDRIVRTPFILRKLHFKEMIEKSLMYPEDSEHRLVNPEAQIAFRHKQKSELDLLIENERDEQVQKHLNDYINANEKREYRLDVGILFGDGHMPIIYETLRSNGFHWKLEEKLSVL
jgi:hypothetical protein